MPAPVPTAEPMVNCPKCGHGFRLTETLAAPIVEAEKKALEARLRSELAADKEAATRDLAAKLEAESKKLREAQAKELAILQRESALKERLDGLDLEISKRLATEQDKIAARAREKALAEAGLAEAALRTELAEKQAKLAAAEQVELDARRMKAQLEEERRTLELDKQRALDAAKAEIREAALKEAAEASKFRDAEKDKTIGDLMRSLEEARRKAEQGSQQLQGEILELELEGLLRSRFPTDGIEPVGKGEFGGDVLQRVYDPPGVLCGTILWESKRTKAWSDGWLPKLRDDQRAAKAEAAILVTIAMPKGLDGFGEIDRVWIASPKLALAVAGCVRDGLVAVAATRRADEGLETKAEEVYAYLTGPRFKQRVEAMVEAFRTLKDQLDAERRAFEKQWAAREKQLDRFMRATAGMYGDVLGIAGKAAPQIPALEMDGGASDDPPRPADG